MPVHEVIGVFHGVAESGSGLPGNPDITARVVANGINHNWRGRVFHCFNAQVGEQQKVVTVLAGRPLADLPLDGNESEVERLVGAIEDRVDKERKAVDLRTPAVGFEVDDPGQLLEFALDKIQAGIDFLVACRLGAAIAVPEAVVGVGIGDADGGQGRALVVVEGDEEIVAPVVGEAGGVLNPEEEIEGYEGVAGCDGVVVDRFGHRGEGAVGPVEAQGGSFSQGPSQEVGYDGLGSAGIVAGLPSIKVAPFVITFGKLVEIGKVKQFGSRSSEHGEQQEG